MRRNELEVERQELVQDEDTPWNPYAAAPWYAKRFQCPVWVVALNGIFLIAVVTNLCTVIANQNAIHEARITDCTQHRVEAASNIDNNNINNNNDDDDDDDVSSVHDAIRADHLLVDMPSIQMPITEDSVLLSLSSFLQSQTAGGMGTHGSPIVTTSEDRGMIIITTALARGSLSVLAWPSKAFISVQVSVECDEVEAVGMVQPILQSFHHVAPTTQTSQTRFGDDKGIHKWSVRRSGIDANNKYAHTTDIDTYVLGEHSSTEKKLVEHITSEFQDIQIWDLTDNWLIAAEPNNRCLFLDGTLQSCLSDEHVYHEALVHAAMISHPNPKRVAILGGGEGATLREVLKHTTVTDVQMIEIDTHVVEAAQRSLPTMPADSWHDPRAHHVAEGAETYFQRYFGKGHRCNPDATPGNDVCFDVVIVDVLDPEFAPSFMNGMFSPHFVRLLDRGTSENAVVVWQIGEGMATRASTANDIKRLQFMEMLYKSADFSRIQVYNQIVPSFLNTWDFMVAFKSAEETMRFHRNPSAIDLDLVQPLQPGTQLHHFDGPTMLGFQNIPRAYQSHYCGQEWVSASSSPDGVRDRCSFLLQTGMDGAVPFNDKEPGVANVADGEPFLEVRKSEHIPIGRGVFTTQNIAQGERFGAFDAATSMVVPRLMYKRLKAFADEWGEHGPLYKSLLDWIDRFGYYCDWQGGEYYISVGSKNTFTNHACLNNQTFIEGPFDHGKTLDELWSGATEVDFMDLVSPRHARTVCVEQRAKRVMPAGTEILDSFINYYDPEVQPEKITMVREWCGQDNAMVNLDDESSTEGSGEEYEAPEDDRAAMA